MDKQIEEKEILAGNTLIAEFMGAKKRWFEFRGYHDASEIRDEANPHLPTNHENGPYKKPNKWYQHYKWQMNEKDKSGQFDSWLSYHKEWNWLMPVKEKIEQTGANFTIGTGKYCDIVMPKEASEMEEEFDFFEFHVSTEADPVVGKFNSQLEAVWLCVVQFIQWHNNTQTKNS